MAKETKGAADRLSALVAEIEAEAYAQGKANAWTDFLAALGASEISARPTRRNRPSGTRLARKRRADGGKRAPKGSVRALVERTLRDRSGLTAPEILDRAATDAERMIKLSSIRVDLQNGRRQGRYDSVDGRWSLAASSSADGGGAPDTLGTPEPAGTEAAPSDAPPSEAGPSPEPDAATGSQVGDTPGKDAESPDRETAGDRSTLGMNW